MENVICDTMIWYYLGNDLIQIPKNKANLIGTSVSIREFGTTPNLRAERINLLQNAVRAFITYPQSLIKINPIEYLVKYFFSDFNVVDNVENKLIESFKLLVSTNLSEISDMTYEETKIQINKVRSQNQKNIEQINKNIIPKRIDYIKKNHIARDFRKADKTYYAKEYFCDLISNFTKNTFDNEYRIDPNDKRWEDFELFVLAWETFHKELDLGSEKLKENDWVDLFNLVYVKPRYKYWTEDKKWIRVFNLNNKLKNYIFRPQP